jgi:hypothetical protein
MEKLMDLFERQMGGARHLPKVKLYPCLLALCDEQIVKMNTRVSMMASSDIAGGGSSGNGWRSKGHQGAHATNYQDEGTTDGSVRKGSDGRVLK